MCCEHCRPDGEPIAVAYPEGTFKATPMVMLSHEDVDRFAERVRDACVRGLRDGGWR